MEKRKFKYKALYEGKLYPVQAIWGWDNTRMVRISTPTIEVHDFEPEAVVEYSGVNDKDGQEIYEHSIVRGGYGFGIVEFHNGAFMIVWQDDKEAMMESLAMRYYASGRLRDDLELLGNIYENPELLK